MTISLKDVLPLLPGAQPVKEKLNAEEIKRLAEGYEPGLEVRQLHNSALNVTSDVETCSKCDSIDIGIRYRKPGDNGYEQEHLLFICNECAFEWRTLCKDAK